MDYNLRTKDFLKFIRNPDNNKLENITTLNKLKKLFKIYLITLLTLTLLNLLKRLFIKLGVPINFNQFFNELPVVKDKNATLIYIMFALFFPPILEEFSFRLFLSKYNKKFISISLSAIIGYCIYSILHNHLWYPDSLISLNLISYLYPFLFAMPFLIIFLTQKKINLERIWDKYFSLIFYIVTLLFAIIHLTTLKLEPKQYIFSLIIILPFLVTGVSFGYTRIRYGLQYAMLLHFILNAPTLLRILFQIQ